MDKAVGLPLAQVYNSTSLPLCFFLFILYSVFLGVSETPASSILHRYVEDRQRSTMLSLRSLVQQLGAALGLILAGFIAEVYSTPTAWVIGSVFLVLAVLLISILAKRLTSEND